MPTNSAQTAQPALHADAFWRSLVAAASAGYRAADAHAYRFARAKLSGDRVFRHVLERRPGRPRAQVLDLGCGQGLLASLLHAAAEAAKGGRWPSNWAAAPEGVRVAGIDPLPLDIQRAITAVGDAATFIRGDMRRFELPPCDTAVFFDTLHYIAPQEQGEVLSRVRSVLRPGGTMLLRVGDASRRGRFDSACGSIDSRCCSSRRRLREGRGPSARGLEIDSRGDWDCRSNLSPMSGRPPFADLLIVARLPRAARQGKERASGIAQPPPGWPAFPEQGPWGKGGAACSKTMSSPIRQCSRRRSGTLARKTREGGGVDRQGDDERRRAILITGAASEIGLATARLFDGAGLGRRRLRRQRDSPRGAARRDRGMTGAGMFRLLDVTDRPSRCSPLSPPSPRRRLAVGFDVLFNNAGVDAKGQFEEMCMGDGWSALVNVNLSRRLQPDPRCDPIAEGDRGIAVPIDGLRRRRSSAPQTSRSIPRPSTPSRVSPRRSL